MKVRFLDLNNEDVSKTLLVDANDPDRGHAMKVRALKALGIEVREGEKPLHA